MVICEMNTTRLYGRGRGGEGRWAVDIDDTISNIVYIELHIIKEI